MKLHRLKMTDNGSVYTAKTYEGLIIKLHKDQWVMATDPIAYKHGFSSRLQKLEPKSELRTDTAKHFVTDLVALGFATLTSIETDEEQSK